MPTIVRPLATGDRTRWEELFNGYAEFYKTDISTSSLEVVWNWIFAPTPNFWCVVALDENEQIIGFAHYNLIPRPVGGSMICFLHDLYVGPTSRGAGAGKALIDNVVEFTKANNLPNLRWLTQEFNYPARRVYDGYNPKSDFIMYNLAFD